MLGEHEKKPNKILCTENETKFYEVTLDFVNAKNVRLPFPQKTTRCNLEKKYDKLINYYCGKHTKYFF